MLYSNSSSIYRIILLGLFLLTVICSIPTTQINADTTIWKNVTVFSASGLEYWNIDIEIAASGKEIVLIKDDNSQQKMRISNIKLIMDSQGKDITAQILDIAENSQKLNTAQEMGIESDESNVKKRFGFGLSGGIGYSWTAFDWFEGITSGTAFAIDMKYLVNRRGIIGVQYRYQNLGVDNDLEGEFNVCDDNFNCMLVNVDWNVHLSEYFLYFGSITEPKTLRKPIGYFLIGMGLIDHAMEITVSDDNSSETVNDDTIKFAMLYAGGIIVPLNRRLGVKLEADLRMTGDNYYPFASLLADEGTSLGLLFGLELGIIYMIGGEM